MYNAKNTNIMIFNFKSTFSGIYAFNNTFIIRKPIKFVKRKIFRSELYVKRNEIHIHVEIITVIFSESVKAFSNLFFSDIKKKQSAPIPINVMPLFKFWISDMYNRIKPEMISIIPIKIAVINGGFLKKGLFSFPVTCLVSFDILNFNPLLNFSLV